MRSVSGDAFGSWSEAVNISVVITPPNNLPLTLGLSIPFGILGAVVLTVIVLLVMFLTSHQIKLRHSLKVSWISS